MDVPTIEISNSVSLWIAYGLAFTLGLVMKDLLTSFVQGALFKFNRDFSEGDEVILDDEDAYIVSIGWRYTKFGVYKEQDILSWRYVPNTRIQTLKLEKIVRASDSVKWYSRRHPDRCNVSIKGTGDGYTDED